MKISHIKEVIPETNIMILSPHYDDVLFMLGGYIEALKSANLLSTKQFDIKLIFAQSNYQARTGEGNFDVSTSRIKFATGNRLIEDIQCNNELLGSHNYKYELLNELECFARGKAFANSEMEFPHGMFPDFDENDHVIYERMKDRIRSYAAQSDTAIVFPMAIKEHIDHFIIREAGLFVAKELGVNAHATFYFQEDKPYGGIATAEELARMDCFVTENNLHSCWFEYEPAEMIEMAFKHYISQVEDVYKKGINDRAAYWQDQLLTSRGVDRICKYQA
ncbi:hypothetical protein N7E81_07685 [Reichenbachiella carrageenanivorans]|uniref:GlcNAc-PI de-N-acetylase n=1 Tax=Reichenbachiella carrageenanivorans TaxID=2979869 RepID=A0ABY6D4E9_9BACT|nr:hypothetical protein [Reichenbachiella carrageenanivorans]UXX80978.1 hypothetical protein N7E81_07685 [Reichenbachiella carrageenanivorans]